MPAPEFPSAVVALLLALNGNDYNATTNPYGLARGGHRQNWPNAMNGMGTMGTWVHDITAYLEGLAEQVGEDADSAAAGSGTEASISTIRAAADVAHYISMRRAVAAQAPVAMTDAGTIAWDMASGINFIVTLGAAGRTLANPTNQIVGKSGLLIVKQDGTGGRTISTWGNNLRWIGGEPEWPDAANALSVISYYVPENGTVLLSFGGSSA